MLDTSFDFLKMNRHELNEFIQKEWKYCKRHQPELCNKLTKERNEWFLSVTDKAVEVGKIVNFLDSKRIELEEKYDIYI